MFGIAVDQTGPDAVGPPSWLFFGLLAELIATILCFLPATRPIHMVGYFIGGVAVALTAVVYRSIDRKRQRSTVYVAHPVQGRLLIAVLVLAIGFAAWHGYYIAQSRVVAKW